ncbi:hypothetical protein P378_00295 [Desulforamulus profundi]|uniref:Uncharacterized protein n=1 Tax=Desulforamulus profundi TaxID=1383067 RepID=A0A2C6MJH1_9FIRM|nr:hypothetical protein P378_00295 [Desulforamulus profundi]
MKMVLYCGAGARCFRKLEEVRRHLYPVRAKLER